MSYLDEITADRPLLLVGGGRMGSALLSGWLFEGLPVRNVVVAEPDNVTAANLAAKNPGLIVEPSAEEVGHLPSVIVLAVKPQMMEGILPPLSAFDNALFISIAAGRSIASFEAAFGPDTAIIRAMPNTPAAIGKGMTVCVGNGNVAKAHRHVATGLLEAVGDVAWIDREDLMDAVTAVSGSGPAYVFYLIECMAKAGEGLGLPGPLAAQLARQTVIGAAALADDSPDGPDQLRRNVTSPGGTTEAALSLLMAEGGLEALMRAAIEAAADRSQELSG